MKTLDLGCGNDKLSGAVGVDIDPNSKADILHDLNVMPYPFENNEFDYVRMKHSLEHLRDIKEVLNEVIRITKPKGKILLQYPHFSSESAYTNYDHKHYLGLSSFMNFPHLKLLRKELHWSPSNKRWWYRLIDKLITSLANINQGYAERFWCYYVGGFFECVVMFEVVK
ncbi:MAG: methyltransferase domain-containing protein [Candidatus Micrarchaeota archaeon]|nr:methyltransferase domain-containing protein [Candidatus Micrarchaeota archaeon]